mgnify:CR=1 FL=1
MLKHAIAQDPFIIIDEWVLFIRVGTLARKKELIHMNQFFQVMLIFNFLRDDNN